MRSALDSQLSTTRLSLESKMNSVSFELDRLHKLLHIRPTTSEFQQVRTYVQCYSDIWCPIILNFVFLFVFLFVLLFVLLPLPLISHLSLCPSVPLSPSLSFSHSLSPSLSLSLCHSPSVPLPLSLHLSLCHSSLPLCPSPPLFLSHFSLCHSPSVTLPLFLSPSLPPSLSFSPSPSRWSSPSTRCSGKCSTHSTTSPLASRVPYRKRCVRYRGHKCWWSPYDILPLELICLEWPYITVIQGTLIRAGGSCCCQLLNVEQVVARITVAVRCNIVVKVVKEWHNCILPPHSLFSPTHHPLPQTDRRKYLISFVIFHFFLSLIAYPGFNRNGLLHETAKDQRRFAEKKVWS